MVVKYIVVFVNNLRYILLFTLIAVSINANQLYAQNQVSFVASAPSAVNLGEVFRISYSVNQKPDQFNGPRIDHFQFNGPMLSTNMSTQIINGKISQSSSYVYNYTLQATQVGVFTIAPAEIRIKGKTYHSNSLKIEVVKSQATNQHTNRSAGQNNPGTSGRQIANKSLFARVELDKKNVFKGEQIIATIKIYSQVNLARFGDIKMPSYSGFWTQEIPTPDQVSLHRENVNGVIYNVGTIKQTVLVPQQTGTLTIEPFELECYINLPRQRPGSFFDDFFNNDFFGTTRTTIKRIKSPEVKVEVKPLPPASQNFNGAVGQLFVTTTVDHMQVKTNDAITYKVIVKGKGNLKLIDLPPIDFPADFEVYDPKTTNNTNASLQGISGSKTFEYLIIPRHPGEYRIPSWKFTYFNPESGKYINRTLPACKITVAKGKDENSTVVSGNLGKEDIRLLGKDIRFIKNDSSRFNTIGKTFYGSALFKGLYLSILLIWILLFVARRIKARRMADTEGLKFRKAFIIAHRQLSRLHARMKKGDEEHLPESLLKIIWKYLGDKLNLDFSVLEPESVKNQLTESGINEDEVNRLISLIEECQFYQYAPGLKKADYNNLINQTNKILSQIDRLMNKTK